MIFRKRFVYARSCRGFTLVELLVVMLIIGILAAMLVPAVQKARESARVASCANNLRQIGTAIANYEARNKHYPPSCTLVAPDASGNLLGWSAQAKLLPYLEQSVLYSKIDFSVSFEEQSTVQTADGEVTELSALRVPTYLCPSERRDEVRLKNGERKHYPLNYAMNLGVWFIWDPETGAGGQGPFYPFSEVAAAEIRDGLSATLCAAEVKAWNPYYRNAAYEDPAMPGSPADVCSLGGAEFKTNSGHTEWIEGRAHQTGFTTTFAPNTPVLCEENGETYDVDWNNQQEGKSETVPTCGAITARSYHEGGVNAVLMDGSVHWFDDEINLGVWRAYSTRDGGELIPAEEQVQ